MLTRKCIGSVALFLALAFSLPLYAHGLIWRFLGDTRIGGSHDHDKIQVDSRQGPFRAVQLRVSGDPVFCQRLVVNYSNGTSEELAIGDRISSQGSARIIDLAGEARVLKSVEFWYFRESWEHTPRISLYGTR
jgi:hypothetical protein